MQKEKEKLKDKTEKKIISGTSTVTEMGICVPFSSCEDVYECFSAAVSTY